MWGEALSLDQATRFLSTLRDSQLNLAFSSNQLLIGSPFEKNMYPSMQFALEIRSLENTLNEAYIIGPPEGESLAYEFITNERQWEIAKLSRLRNIPYFEVFFRNDSQPLLQKRVLLFENHSDMPQEISYHSLQYSPEFPFHGHDPCSQDPSRNNYYFVIEEELPQNKALSKGVRDRIKK